MAIQTTDLVRFWRFLNAELLSRGLPEAGFGQANELYQEGVTYQEAAGMIETELLHYADEERLTAQQLTVMEDKLATVDARMSEMQAHLKAILAHLTPDPRSFK